MKQNGFVGKIEAPAAATPRTAAPELPGPLVHRSLLVSWGSRAAEQIWILPGWQWGTHGGACVQESQGGIPQSRVSTLEEKCGLLLAGSPQQQLPFSTPSVLASEGVI